ncbi:MAG: recombination regulator RecX [Gammaproteobacteria bacterium]|nr:recombination regulator RecX [Gammaproteobacteria bacterium]
MSDDPELPDASPRDARLAAMRLLTRREHSCKELKQKLQHKGFNAAQVEKISNDLQREGLLSDARFAESYLRARSSKGYGPVRIQLELKQRGASEDIVSATVMEDDAQWFELARRVREKRFGRALPATANERLKQQRFLQYRGFNQQHLKFALSDDAELPC